MGNPALLKYFGYLSDVKTKIEMIKFTYCQTLIASPNITKENSFWYSPQRLYP